MNNCVNFLPSNNFIVPCKLLWYNVKKCNYQYGGSGPISTLEPIKTERKKDKLGQTVHKSKEIDNDKKQTNRKRQTDKQINIFKNGETVCNHNNNNSLI